MNEYDEIMRKLMSSFTFSKADLDYNEKGTFSPRQRDILRSKQKGYFFLLCVFAPASLLGAMVATLPAFQRIDFFVWVATLMCLLATLSCLQMVYQIHHDLRGTHIKKIGGRLTLRKLQHNKRRDSYTPTYDYYLQIGTYNEKTTEDYYKRLLPLNGLDMIAYCTPRAKRLLSVAYMGGDTYKDDLVESQIIQRKQKPYHDDLYIAVDYENERKKKKWDG